MVNLEIDIWQKYQRNTLALRSFPGTGSQRTFTKADERFTKDIWKIYMVIETYMDEGLHNGGWKFTSVYIWQMIYMVCWAFTKADWKLPLEK